MTSIEERIKDALLDNDVSEVRRLYRTNGQIEMKVCGAINLLSRNDIELSYEVLNYLLSINNRCIAKSLSKLFITQNDANRFLHVLPYLKPVNAISILRQAVFFYEYRYQFDLDLVSDSKKILLAVIDKFEDTLTLNDIYALFGHDVNHIYIADIISYITFRVLTKEKLEEADPDVVSTLTRFAFIAGAPQSLIDTLSEYSTKIDEETLADIISRATNIDEYVSLFEEGI